MEPARREVPQRAVQRGLGQLLEQLRDEPPQGGAALRVRLFGHDRERERDEGEGSGDGILGPRALHDAMGAVWSNKHPGALYGPPGG